MRTSAFFGIKYFGYFEIYDGEVEALRHGQGGVEPVQTFFGQRGQLLAILCGRLLWTTSHL